MDNAKKDLPKSQHQQQQQQQQPQKAQDQMQQKEKQSDSPSISTDRKTDDPGHSKATNAFFIFLHEFRQNLMKDGDRSLKPTEIAQMAGELWRNMSHQEKLTYKLWAKKNRTQKNGERQKISTVPSSTNTKKPAEKSRILRPRKTSEKQNRVTKRRVPMKSTTKTKKSRRDYSNKRYR